MCALFSRIFLAAILGILATPLASADVSKGLKDRLFARYDQKKLSIVLDGKMRVTAVSGSGSSTVDYSINYDHFHSSIPRNLWPGGYLKRNQIDEYTTEEVMSRAQFADPLVAGEMIMVRKFYVSANKDGVLRIDFYLIALDGKRVMRIHEIYPNGSEGMSHTVDFGFHFRFYFGPIVPGSSEDEYFKDVAQVIDRYMVPAEEFLQSKKEAAASAEAKKNVDIQPGMTKDEVVKLLGEPQKTITFGEKTILKYTDLTVELQGGKVVDVKAN